MSVEATFRRLLLSGRLDLPLPGSGGTVARHMRLAEIARDDLELGRLVEAHVDAVAILREAGLQPTPRALYGVWASEGKGELVIRNAGVSGQKSFCTGADIVDRVLVTVMRPDRRLVEVDLRVNRDRIIFDTSGWATDAFAATQTATATFVDCPVSEESFVGSPCWYFTRSGFWHGACGPASCWAGGALALIDYARRNTRENNPHALAHVGALTAIEWEINALLKLAGEEIDSDPGDANSARVRALRLRHLIEQACTETLNRFGRAFGPRPLAFDGRITRLHQELTLYIRQSHAEADLEELGRQSLTARDR